MPGVCPRCLREVYFAEEKRALGKVWHTFCFSCRNCRKLLDSCTVSTHCGELFCRNCCTRLFTQSIKPSSPSTDCSDVLKNTGVTPAETNSISDSISDCCCCCTENAPDTPSGITKNSQLEEGRLRGGGGEDEDVNCHLTSGTERCSESDCSNLGIISSVTLCNPSSSPAAVTTWYNRQHSASQSTFGYQPCARSYSARPSSTPICGTISKFRNTDNSNKFTDKKSGSSSNPNKCLVLRRPGSPCRTVIQQLQQHQHLHQQQVKKHQRENQRNSHHHRSEVKQQCYQQRQHQRNKTSGCYSGSDSIRSSSPLRTERLSLSIIRRLESLNYTNVKSISRLFHHEENPRIRRFHPLMIYCQKEESPFATTSLPTIILILCSLANAQEWRMIMY
ncbi:uncharacterized protein LOC107263752 isoform X2 [Cephus cinctus]|uniref:Uncharacterized protein LOC107263752 isoform X2 n=1 Tax=Cephus cinctus TaxID=211228 RepID=A0AAJ7R990_CEPCN|nr:uncharacterized protein LOC107263752 isoform X2 [Cephus cinctus]